MTEIWAVMGDGHGAHEAEAVMSLWLTEADAQADCARLNRREPSEGRPEYYVKCLPVGVPAPDDWSTLT